MEKNIINTGTITNAIKGRDALRNKGYHAYMFRTSGKASQGCGYSVSCECSEETIIDIFEKEKIKYLSIVRSGKI